MVIMFSTAAKFDDVSQVIIIAQQIAQGMGYLHHKGIIHKVAQIFRHKVSKSSSLGLEDKEYLLGER